MKQQIQQFARELDAAYSEAKAIPQLTSKYAITLNEAYNIQKSALEFRFDRGEKLAGLKMGFTNKAKMEKMGVEDLICGRLTDAMQVKNNDSISLKHFIRPRIEPEIAFLLKHDISSTIPLKDARAYTAGIAGALEIIDSRYENFKFCLEDVIADNSAAAGYVIGEWMAPETNISNINLEFAINNKRIQTGNSSAILENPWQSLVEAVRLAHQQAIVLKKGMVILAGAITPAAFIKSDDHIAVTFEKLGKVTLKVEQ